MHGRIEKRSKDGWTIVIEMGKNPLTNKRERMYKTVKGPKKEAEREMHIILHRIAIH